MIKLSVSKISLSNTKCSIFNLYLWKTIQCCEESWQHLNTKEIPPFLISLESEREQLQSTERKTRQRPRHPRPLHLSVRVRQQSGQQQSHSRQQLTCLHPASQPCSPACRRRRSYASVHTPPQSPARAPDLTGRASHRGGQPTDARWRCLCSQRSVELLIVRFYSVIYLFLLSVEAYLSRFPT